MRLLLASRSAARRAMLEAAGVPFETVISDLDEEAAKAALRPQNLAAPRLAAALAKQKAGRAEAAAGDLVLGCDQVLERDDGEILNKPASREDAFRQLRSLSGKPHRLHSAAAIMENGALAWQGTETVKLVMRPLSDAFLADYLDREFDAVRWNVGAYRIEGLGVQLFDRIEGSHFAILGLPLLPLLLYLRERGLLAS